MSQERAPHSWDLATLAAEGSSSLRTQSAHDECCLQADERGDGTNVNWDARWVEPEFGEVSVAEKGTKDQVLQLDNLGSHFVSGSDGFQFPA
ncbi:MAG: hypothetical protein WD851_12405 [Pirellulales bacterium]